MLVNLNHTLCPPGLLSQLPASDYNRQLMLTVAGFNKLAQLAEALPGALALTQPPQEICMPDEALNQRQRQNTGVQLHFHRSFVCKLETFT